MIRGRLLGDPLPVRLEFWDGTSLGPPDGGAGTLHVRLAGRVPPDPVEPQRARPGAGVRRRRDRRRRRPLRDRRRRCAAACPEDIAATMLRLVPAAMQRGPPPRRARSAAAAAARGGPAARRPPLAAPRRRGDRPPLRRRQRLLPARARPGDDVLVRPLRRRRRPTSTTAQAAKHDLICRKLGLDAHAGRAPARRRVRVGIDGHPRRRRTTTCRSSASRSARPRPRWPASGSPRPASPTGSRSDCRTTATSAAETFDAISSIGMSEHVGQREPRPLLRAAARRAAARGSAAEPRHQLGRRLEARAAVVRRSLRVPRRRADRRRRERAGDGAGRLRGPRRRVAARALRPHAAGVGRQPGGRMGRGGGASSAVRGRGSGGSTWPARRSAFTDGGIAIHQVLGVVPTTDGASGMPPTRRSFEGCNRQRRHDRGDGCRVEVLVEAGDVAVARCASTMHAGTSTRLTGPVRRHEHVLLHEAVVGGRAADLGVAAMPCRFASIHVSVRTLSSRALHEPVGVVPDLGVGRVDLPDGVDVAGLDGREEALGHVQVIAHAADRIRVLKGIGVSGVGKSVLRHSDDRKHSDGEMSVVGDPGGDEVGDLVAGAWPASWK